MRKIYTLTLLFSIFATQLFAQTPFASYPLDGNANDVAGNNLNGSIVGNPTTTSNRNGINGKALLFSGGGDYIDLPTDFDFPNRTVIVWGNVSQVPSGNGNPLYASDHGGLQYGNTYIVINKENAQNANVIHFGAGSQNYEYNVSLNTWYQAAVVRSTSEVRLFVNGALVASFANPNTYHSTNGVSHATVGTDRIYGTFTYGKIDDLSIYDVALSDAQISGIYTSLKDVHEIDDRLTVYTENGNVVSKFTADDYNSKVKAVRLMDVNGKVLAEKKNAFSGTINESYLPAGVYFVTVEVENAARNISRKVVVAE